MASAPRGDELPALSFFDEDDEPRRTTAAAPRAPGGGGVATTDSQTLLIRRAVARVGGSRAAPARCSCVNSCRDRQRENALKDYNRAVCDDRRRSRRRQVGGAVLPAARREGGGSSPQDLQTEISGYRVQAEQQYEQAERLDVPGRDAGRAAGRADRARVAARRRSTRSPSRSAPRSATRARRPTPRSSRSPARWQVVPRLRRGVGHARDPVHHSTRSTTKEIGGQQIAASQFLPSIRLAAAADRRRGARPAAHERRRRRRAASRPARACTAPASTRRRYGDSTLQPGASEPAHLRARHQPFAVKFTNQGENDEFDVKVTVRIQREGGDPITTSRDDPEARRRQESATVELPLDDAAADRHRGDDPRQRRQGAGRGEDRQQPVRVPGAVRARLSVRSARRLLAPWTT